MFIHLFAYKTNDEALALNKLFSVASMVRKKDHRLIKLVDPELFKKIGSERFVYSFNFSKNEASMFVFSEGLSIDKLKFNASNPFKRIACQRLTKLEDNVYKFYFSKFIVEPNYDLNTIPISLSLANGYSDSIYMKPVTMNDAMLALYSKDNFSYRGLF